MLLTKKNIHLSPLECLQWMILNLQLKIFKDKGCPFELMHTVSTYPMSDKDANLKCIPMLKNTFGCDVGYSGHESGLAISYRCSALGELLLNVILL